MTNPNDVRKSIAFLDERFPKRTWVGGHVFWNNASYLLAESME